MQRRFSKNDCRILKGKGRVAAAAAMERGILLTEDLFRPVCSTYPCTKH
ncbi:MAG: hypothetical protein V8Q17_10815 [Acutalibacteraceae bacterium]